MIAFKFLAILFASIALFSFGLWWLFREKEKR